MDAKEIKILVIFAFLIIYNVIKYYKKSKTESDTVTTIPDFSGKPVPNPNSKTPDELDELKRKLIQERKLMQERREQKEKAAQAAAQAKITTPIQPEEAQPVLKSVKEKPVSPVFIEEDEIKDNEISDISFQTEEDVKRAFLYSEIWNRKYC